MGWRIEFDGRKVETKGVAASVARPCRNATIQSVLLLEFFQDVRMSSVFEGFVQLIVNAHRSRPPARDSQSFREVNPSRFNDATDGNGKLGMQSEAIALFLRFGRSELIEENGLAPRQTYRRIMF
jgi:hypothetical protein